MRLLARTEISVSTLSTSTQCRTYGTVPWNITGGHLLGDLRMKVSITLSLRSPVSWSVSKVTGQSDGWSETESYWYFHSLITRQFVRTFYFIKGWRHRGGVLMHHSSPYAYKSSNQKEISHWLAITYTLFKLTNGEAHSLALMVSSGSQCEKIIFSILQMQVQL